WTRALAPRAPRDGPAGSPRRLLDLDGAAGLLELGLELLGLLAVDALLDRAGRAVDQRLGLLEAEAGGRAHRLDHGHLLVAGAGEDHVDGATLLSAAFLAATAAGRGRSRGRRGDRGRRDAELLL